MAPYYAHGARPTAHRTAHGGAPRNISSANSTQLGPDGHRTSTRFDEGRARETQRRRSRQERRTETFAPRSPSPTVSLRRPSRLADRMTYGYGTEVQGSDDYGDDDDDNASSRPQQARSLRDRITHSDGFNGDGGPVHPVSQRGGQQSQAVHINTDNVRDDTDMEADDFHDLFDTEPPTPTTPRTTPQPVNTKPVQYGSSHDLPFNLHLHPPHPVQSATGPDPIRMVTSWTPHEPDIDGLTASPSIQPPSKPVAKAPEAKKRPVNMYKGNDPIKRLVQNEKLRAILGGKGLPRPRKKPDRMDLKCAGRKVFR